MSRSDGQPALGDLHDLLEPRRDRPARRTPAVGRGRPCRTAAPAPRGGSRSPSRSRPSAGDASGRPSVGPVKPTSRRYGSTGSSTPTERAIAGDHDAGRADDRRRSRSCRGPSRRRGSPRRRRSIPVTAQPVSTVAPWRRAPAAYPCSDGLGARVAVERAVRRREHAVEPGERAQLARPRRARRSGSGRRARSGARRSSRRPRRPRRGRGGRGTRPGGGRSRRRAARRSA